MQLPNPYVRLEKRAAALAAVITPMEDLAKEFWEVGKPVWFAVTVVHFADFRTAEVCFPPFVELGQILTREALVEQVNSSLEEKHASLGWSFVPHHEPTDKQRACWVICEMIQAGLAADQSRFDQAFSAITADPEALPHLRPLFREVGELWTSLVYSRHIVGFIDRAKVILEPTGLTVTHDALRHFRLLLSTMAYHALATWAEWVERPGAVRPMGVSEYGPSCGFPLWPMANVGAGNETVDASPRGADNLSDQPDECGAERGREPEFQFSPDGDGYAIRGFGERGHLSRSRGMLDIAMLLKHAGRPVLMLELDGLGNDQRQDKRSVQPAFDKKALGDLLKMRQRYEQEITESESEIDKADSQRALDELNDQLASATGLNGKPRDLNSQFEKLRPKIHDRLKTVFRKMRESNPPLVNIANHLETSISATGGNSFVYQPTGTSPAWVLEIQK